jgi:hypothetical protein
MPITQLPGWISTNFRTGRPLARSGHRIRRPRKIGRTTRRFRRAPGILDGPQQ